MAISTFRWLATLLAITALVAAGACATQRQTPSDGGPVNQGLRLRLAIVSSRANGQDKHRISLSVINARPVPVTLVASSFGGPQPDDTFSTFVANSTSFTSQPLLFSDNFQTGGDGSNLPNPTVTLAGGGSTMAEWTVTGNTFSSYQTNSMLILPMDGLYLLRAHLIVRTDDQPEIDLWSNEAPCSIGGSLEAPRKCMTTIIAIAPDHTVTLDLGSEHGVKVGDRYLAKTRDTHLLADIRWQSLVVTKVNFLSCTAVPEPGGDRIGNSGDTTTVPWFPQLRSLVNLITPDAWRPQPASGTGAQTR